MFWCGSIAERAGHRRVKAAVLPSHGEVNNSAIDPVLDVDLRGRRQAIAEQFHVSANQSGLDAMDKSS